MDQKNCRITWEASKVSFHSQNFLFSFFLNLDFPHLPPPLERIVTVNSSSTEFRSHGVSLDCLLSQFQSCELTENSGREAMVSEGTPASLGPSTIPDQAC